MFSLWGFGTFFSSFSFFFCCSLDPLSANRCDVPSKPQLFLVCIIIIYRWGGSVQTAGVCQRLSYSYPSRVLNLNPPGFSLLAFNLVLASKLPFCFCLVGIYDCVLYCLSLYLPTYPRSTNFNHLTKTLLSITY